MSYNIADSHQLQSVERLAFSRYFSKISSHSLNLPSPPGIPFYLLFPNTDLIHLLIILQLHIQKHTSQLLNPLDTRAKNSLCLVNLSLLPPAVHHRVNKQSRFRKGQRGHVLELAKLQASPCIFVAGGLLPRATSLRSGCHPGIV